MEKKKITKAEIVDILYSQTNCERKIIKDVVDGFIEQLRGGLENGATIELRGFGTLEPRLRKGREKLRCPKNGNPCPPTKSHYVAVFRAGCQLENNLKKLSVEIDKKN